MSDLDPFDSTKSIFTSVGLVFAAGAKLTKEKLNEVVRNTGFNWLGGRHPMRESFGVAVITLTSDNVDGNRLVEPVRTEISISSRLEGVYQFTNDNSYQVYCVMNTARKIDFIINQGEENFNTLFELPRDFFNMINVTVVSQERDSFTIQFNSPQLRDVSDSQELSIAWFAKGY